jgi:erythromycin esterase
MIHVIADDRFVERGLERTDQVVAQLASTARPLASDADLDPLLTRIGDAQYVLLGAASHGCSEFLSWRTRISQRLIREKGFSFLAVEGDWPDCYRVNRYVKLRADAGRSARDVLEAFDRWPGWMWANRELAALAEWLRHHNTTLAEERRVGFYGLDVFSLWDSMRTVVEQLDRVDPEAGVQARRAYECFAPFTEDPAHYARATPLAPAACEGAVVHALAALRRQAPSFDGDGGESGFAAEQNALSVENAEFYYRNLVRGGAASWNVRDTHMMETLERLQAFHGAGAKAIVWAHDAHIGDARYTDLAGDGEVNLGQLLRQRHGEAHVVLVGFSAHRGTLIASEQWGAPMQRMRMPEARPGSYDDVLHRLGGEDKLLVLSEAPQTLELLEPRGQRAIGVVYRPQFEQFGNYVPSVLPRRYDVLLHIEQTQALAPLHTPVRTESAPPETGQTGI